LLWGALFEFNQPTRPHDLEDESIGSFLERRFGTPDVGNNVVSAVLHGIYAGDIYKLSIKSLLPAVWHSEGVWGSISQSSLNTARTGERPALLKDVRLQQELLPKLEGTMIDGMNQASVYTFKGGLGALTNALEKSLKENPNITFRMGQKVNEVEYDAESDGIKVPFLPPSTGLC
jgi:protoporphyrinogen/coproporphyrinogen III oxidase